MSTNHIVFLVFLAGWGIQVVGTIVATLKGSDSSSLWIGSMWGFCIAVDVTAMVGLASS